MSNWQPADDAQDIAVHVPMTFKRRSGRKEIVVPDGLEHAPESGPDYHEALVIAISRAHRWKRLLDDGKYPSVATMAQALKMNRYHMARLLRLTLLAPDIVEAILDGREPEGMSIERLRRLTSALWEEQRDAVRPR